MLSIKRERIMCVLSIRRERVERKSCVCLSIRRERVVCV